MGSQGFGGYIGAAFWDDNGQGALLPLGIGNSDNGGFVNLRVRHQRVFEIDGANPFASRLDQILRTIGDSHVTLAVDRRDVSRSEPAIAGPFVMLGIGLEVTRCDPWTTNFQLSHRLTISWTNAIRVDRANVDERYGQSLPGERGDTLLIGKIHHV